MRYNKNKRTSITNINNPQNKRYNDLFLKVHST